MINKKAMSGLIITVLLVAIALSIGTIIIGWISSYSRDTMSGAQVNQLLADACEKLDVSVVKIDLTDNPDRDNDTYESDYGVRVLVENNADQELAGMVIKAYPDNDEYVYAESVETVVQKYNRDAFDLNISSRVSSDCSESKCYINTVEIIPLVEINPGTPEIHECAASGTKYTRSDSVVRVQN